MSQPLSAPIPTLKSLLNKTTFIWSQSYFIKSSLLFLETSLKLLINLITSKDFLMAFIYYLTAETSY